MGTIRKGKLIPIAVNRPEGEDQDETFAKMDYCLRVAGTYLNVPSTKTLDKEQIKELQKYGKFMYWYLENFDKLHYDRDFVKDDAKIKPINNEQQQSTESDNTK